MMSRIHAILRASALVFAALNICACQKINPAPPETPAPPQPSGREFVYTFDNDAAEKIAQSFHGALTGSGAKGEWAVKTDATAPSQPHIMAQLSADDTSYRFPLAIADEGSFQNLEMSVKFKPVSGSGDQAAGLVWRLKDANNYYIVRANALEDNVVLYKVENGERSDLPLKGEGRTYGKKVKVPLGEWSALRVTVQGKLFTVYFNDQRLYEVEDETFKDAGKIGLWTKADSVTHFDDLRVVAI
jgi:hypothetical protein